MKKGLGLFLLWASGIGFWAAPLAWAAEKRGVNCAILLKIDLRPVGVALGQTHRTAQAALTSKSAVSSPSRDEGAARWIETIVGLYQTLLTDLASTFDSPIVSLTLKRSQLGGVYAQRAYFFDSVRHHLEQRYLTRPEWRSHPEALLDLVFRACQLEMDLVLEGEGRYHPARLNRSKLNANLIQTIDQISDRDF